MPQDVQGRGRRGGEPPFWTDKGIDPKGILRAAFSNAAGNATQGASTITQQYVKILYLTQERSYQRKVKEAILSLKLQRQRARRRSSRATSTPSTSAAAPTASRRPPRPTSTRTPRTSPARVRGARQRAQQPRRSFDPANGKDAKRGAQGALPATSSTAWPSSARSPPRRPTKAAQRLPKFPRDRGGEPLRRPEGPRADDGPRRAAAEHGLHRGGDRRRRPAGHHDVHQEGDGGGRGRRRGGSGPTASATRSCTSASLASSPAPARCAASTAARTTSSRQLNWAVAGGQAGSTFKPFALAAGLKDGFSLKDTFDGNSPYRAPGRQRGREPGRHRTTARAVSLIKATEDSINTAFIDLTMAMDDGPEKIIDRPTTMGIPPAKADQSCTASRATRPASSRSTGVALGTRPSARSTWPTATPRIAERRGGGRAVHHREGRRRRRRDALRAQGRQTDAGVERGHRRRRLLRAAAGRRDRLRHRGARRSTGRRPARPAPRPTTGDAVSSSWFAGYTPQLATAVMYVRGNGNEQLDGYLPSRTSAATTRRETWTAVMSRAHGGRRRRGVPGAGVRRRRGAATDGHAPYTPPPPPKTTKTSRPRRRPSPRSRRRTTPTEPPTEPTDADRADRRPRDRSSRDCRPSRPTPTDRDADGDGRGDGGGQTAGAARATGREPARVSTRRRRAEVARPPDPRRPGRRRAQRGRRRPGRRARAGRHPWWTPVRVVLALAAV